MKKILKITAYFISTVIVLGIILAASLYFYYRPTDPKTMTLDAPNGQVIITSDSFGIPHILALKDDNDAYYALGYMHERDRLRPAPLEERTFAALRRRLADQRAQRGRASSLNSTSSARTW